MSGLKNRKFYLQEQISNVNQNISFYINFLIAYLAIYKRQQIAFLFYWNNLLSSHFFEITCSVALSFLKTISCYTNFLYTKYNYIMHSLSISLSSSFFKFFRNLSLHLFSALYLQLLVAVCHICTYERNEILI